MSPDPAHGEHRTLCLQNLSFLLTHYALCLFPRSRRLLAPLWPIGVALPLPSLFLAVGECSQSLEHKHRDTRLPICPPPGGYLGTSGQGASTVWRHRTDESGVGRTAQVFIMLLTTVCRLKRMNCSLLEFSVEYFWTKVTETAEGKAEGQGGRLYPLSPGSHLVGVLG